MENQIVSTKITRPRVGSTKITRQRDGWVGQHKKNSTKDGESNSKHENNSPKGWEIQK